MTDETQRPSEEAGLDNQDDTEGHSLATYEFGRLVSRERTESAERAAKQARMREKDDKRR